MEETNEPTEAAEPSSAEPAAGGQPPSDLLPGRTRASSAIIDTPTAAEYAAAMLAAEESINEELARSAREHSRQRMRRPILLFVLTMLSTFLVGAGYDPLVYLLMELRGVRSPMEYLFYRSLADNLMPSVVRGLLYSIPLMTILLAHEMGHYLTALRRRVPASLPYFIPLPLPPLGTMGAVIFQRRGAADRRQMFDVAIWGPLAGLVVTIPVLVWGIYRSEYHPMRPGGLELGEPLIIQWLIALIHGPKPEGQDLFLGSVGLAGWVGVFITGLNLLPVGQLDGGHILYCLIGRRAHYVAMSIVAGAAILMIYTGQYAYVLMLALLIFTGPRHPPTKDDSMPLGVTRHIMGWLTLSFVIIGFTPTPIKVSEPQAEARIQQPAEEQDVRTSQETETRRSGEA